MWTATLKNKEQVGGAIKVTVDYTDGVKTVTESCIPQDRNGFEQWVKSRLATFNGGGEIDSAYAVDEPVVFEEPVVVQPTQAELDQREWSLNYYKLQQVQKLIDLGVLTGTETPVTNLRTKVKNNFQVAYLDLL